MTLEDFAKQAGCVVTLLDDPKGWGGKYQYHSVDHPNCHFCGFRTAEAAYKGFVIDTFGETASKAIFKLLKKVKKQKNESGPSV